MSYNNPPGEVCSLCVPSCLYYIYKEALSFLIDISTKSFKFKANIIGAELTVSVTIFEKAGIIQNDDEEIEVKKGMVKTDILIRNWTFCDPCKSGKKDQIKGKNSAPKLKSTKRASKVGRKRAPSYNLGGNVTLILSKKV